MAPFCVSVHIFLYFIICYPITLLSKKMEKMGRLKNKGNGGKQNGRFGSFY